METLDPRKTQALYMMLLGESYVFIAQTLGVCPKTIRRWADEPEFADALKKESKALANIVRAQGLAVMTHNVDKSMNGSRFLDDLVAAKTAPLAARMRAAGQLMTNGRHWIIYSQKLLQEENCTPVHGYREYEIERQTKKLMKQALKAEAAEAAANAEPSELHAEGQSGHSVPITEKAAPPEPAGNSAMQQALDRQLIDPDLRGAAQELLKADKSGQKRTSEAEHLARRQRLEAREKAERPQPETDAPEEGARRQRNSGIQKAERLQQPAA